MHRTFPETLKPEYDIHVLNMVPNLMIAQILLRNLTNMTLKKIDFVEDYIGEADERLNERGIIG